MLSLLLELKFKTQAEADDVERDKSYGRCLFLFKGDLLTSFVK